jgi:hypothetical protein
MEFGILAVDDMDGYEHTLSLIGKTAPICNII